jgi:hypothetical protein
MADDVSIANKLGQMVPTGKTRDSTEVFVGKEVPHRRKAKKNEPGLKSEKNREEKSETPDPKRNDPPSGRILDIVV